MKRSTTLLLAGAITVFLSACGKGPAPRPEVQKDPSPVVETKGSKSEESKGGDAAIGDRAEASLESPVEPAPAADGNPPETPAPTPDEGQ